MHIIVDQMERLHGSPHEVYALNSALLTDEEMADGIKAFKDQNQEHPWRSMEDPFFGGSGPAQMWALKFKTNSERKPEEGGEQTGATDHP